VWNVEFNPSLLSAKPYIGEVQHLNVAKIPLQPEGQEKVQFCKVKA